MHLKRDNLGPMKLNIKFPKIELMPFRYHKEGDQIRQQLLLKDLLLIAYNIYV